jgi:hypothetical protein
MVKLHNWTCWIRAFNSKILSEPKLGRASKRTVNSVTFVQSHVREASKVVFPRDFIPDATLARREEEILTQNMRDGEENCYTKKPHSPYS